jgi:hypothetical protein
MFWGIGRKETHHNSRLILTINILDVVSKLWEDDRAQKGRSPVSENPWHSGFKPFLDGK